MRNRKRLELINKPCVGTSKQKHSPKIVAGPNLEGPKQATLTGKTAVQTTGTQLKAKAKVEPAVDVETETKRTILNGKGFSSTKKKLDQPVGVEIIWKPSNGKNMLSPSFGSHLNTNAPEFQTARDEFLLKIAAKVPKTCAKEDSKRNSTISLIRYNNKQELLSSSPSGKSWHLDPVMEWTDIHSNLLHARRYTHGLKSMKLSSPNIFTRSPTGKNINTWYPESIRGKTSRLQSSNRISRSQSFPSGFLPPSRFQSTQPNRGTRY